MKTKTLRPWSIIARRELASYFQSPVAYIVTALFLLFSGILFFSTFFLVNRAELRAFFELLPLLYSFFIPALTMRVFSEETKTGTMETLVTLPIKTTDIVAGKYAASFLSSIILIAPTVSYVAACMIFASSGIDAGPIVGGYLGAVFLAAAFTAIGIFSSAVTKNQIVAFFLSMSICIFLTMVQAFSVFIPGAMVNVAAFLSASAHFRSVARGIIDSRDVLYFLSITLTFLVMTASVLENKKRG